MVAMVNLCAHHRPTDPVGQPNFLGCDPDDGRKLLLLCTRAIQRGWRFYRGVGPTAIPRELASFEETPEL